MDEPRAQRTLVKSPPELWEEISDVSALARHLGEFGEIRITRLEPETTVAWEGDRARGTVKLEPSGWGTKVTLTAESTEPPATEPVVAAPPAPEPVVPPAPEPEIVEEPEPKPPAMTEATSPSPRTGLLARLFRRRPGPSPTPEVEVAVEIEVEVEVEASVEPEPEPLAPGPAPAPAPDDRLDADQVTAILTRVLDDLGSAHHRPFSRA